MYKCMRKRTPSFNRSEKYFQERSQDDRRDGTRKAVVVDLYNELCFHYSVSSSHDCISSLSLQ